MTISNYLEDSLLNLVLRNTTFPAIAAVWGSLHTADPGETGTGSPLASSPRFSVAFGAAASATAANNATASVVCNATGTVTYVGLWDGSSTATANHLWSGALGTSKVVANVGDVVTVAVGALTVSLS